MRMKEGDPQKDWGWKSVKISSRNGNRLGLAMGARVLKSESVV